jgi:hypothetical protein
MKWGHDQLANDLAVHLNNASDRMVWTDMQLGPSGSPRPDVYTINMTYSRFCPIAYECKVSVADFRHDITSGKWQSYLTFAAGVVFAVPAGLINKQDVPPGCGLIVRHENGWRMAKGPTLKAGVELPRSAWMKLLIDGIHRSERQHMRRGMSEYAVHRKIEHKYGEELAGVLSRRDRAVSHLEYTIKQIEAKSGELDAFKYVEHQRKELEEFKRIKAELCQVLNIPEHSNMWNIQHEIRSLLKMLDADSAVAEMKSVLENTLFSLKRQVTSLEEIAAPLQGGDQ